MRRTTIDHFRIGDKLTTRRLNAIVDAVNRSNRAAVAPGVNQIDIGNMSLISAIPGGRSTPLIPVELQEPLWRGQIGVDDENDNAAEAKIMRIASDGKFEVTEQTIRVQGSFMHGYHFLRARILVTKFGKYYEAVTNGFTSISGNIDFDQTPWRRAGSKNVVAIFLHDDIEGYTEEETSGLDDVPIIPTGLGEILPELTLGRDDRTVEVTDFQDKIPIDIQLPVDLAVDAHFVSTKWILMSYDCDGVEGNTEESEEEPEEEEEP